MAIPVLVSIHRREGGVEVIHDFALIISGCEGCLRRARYTLTPVEVVRDEGRGVSPVGAPLCKACTMGLPLLDRVTRSTWPTLTALDVEHLWDLARKEQVAQALELGRADATAPGLEGFNGSTTASQQAGKFDRDEARRVRECIAGAEGVLRELKAHAKKVEGRK